MAQQKGLQVLASTPQILHRSFACAHEFSDRLVARIRDPDRSEFPGTVQLGQSLRVAAVGLDPVAGAFWDQRGRDHDAIAPERGELPIQTITCRTGFVAEDQPPVPLPQLRNQAFDRLRRAVDVAEESDLAIATRLGQGHRDP